MPNFLFRIILIAAIIFNSAVFLLYGIAKLAGWQFVHHEPPATLLAKDINPTAAMWYFFGLKKGYAVLVGIAEIFPALLILFKRTRLIGSLFFLFTSANVLAINIFFDITDVTLKISIVLFANTLIILASERKKLLALVGKAD